MKGIKLTSELKILFTAVEKLNIFIYVLKQEY